MLGMDGSISDPITQLLHVSVLCCSEDLRILERHPIITHRCIQTVTYFCCLTVFRLSLLRSLYLGRNHSFVCQTCFFPQKTCKLLRRSHTQRSDIILAAQRYYMELRLRITFEHSRRGDLSLLPYGSYICSVGSE